MGYFVFYKIKKILFILCPSCIGGQKLTLILTILANLSHQFVTMEPI